MKKPAKRVPDPKVPESLVDTLWVHTTFRNGLFVAQVHGVYEGRALLVTRYEFEPQRWNVPVGDLFVEFSSFEFLGYSEELAWIRKYAWVMHIGKVVPRNGTQEWRGPWQIDYAQVARIFFVSRRGMRGFGGSTGNNVDFSDIVRNYRPATNREIRLEQEREQAIDLQPVDPPQPVETPLMPAPPTEEALQREPGPTWHETLVSDDT